MSSPKLRRRRDRLMAQDPHCHWCGCEVIYFKPALGQSLPAHFATLDHLNDRIEEAPRPIRGVIVLACKACNEARAAIRVANLPRNVLNARSGRWPSVPA